MASYFFGDFKDAVVVVPSDTVDFPIVPSGIWVGGAGNVNFIRENGVAMPITGVSGGTMIPIRCKRINLTGTTATNMLAIYR